MVKEPNLSESYVSSGKREPLDVVLYNEAVYKNLTTSCVLAVIVDGIYNI